ncbi:MAG: Ni/Fe hydrogenase subunit alpha [Proteobacteria bacterium]|nr:Ni/Fe hydrogenase subunit alpha [Pseudomonadota bacterium]
MSAKKATAKAPAKKTEPVVLATGKKVEVRHISRVEGHGNIIVEIDAKNKVKACRWEVPEAPRFFEAMILGKSFNQIHQIVSRICGICSIGHQLCSIQTTEDAMGIMVSDQTVRLRKLALHGENLQSHLLHVAYLALPDLMGVGSVIPLAQTHKKELLNLIGLHRMANEFSRATTGRTTHPQRLIPGGFTKVPTEIELREMKKNLEASIPALEAASDLFASVAHKLPNFTRETEYVALVSPVEYAMYWGEVGSTMDQTRPSIYYKDITNEYMVAQSTAKWTKNKGESLMVGALARFNLNHKRLSPLAKGLARKLGLKAPCHNPYYNNLAQLVECAHSVEDSIRLIDELLASGIKIEAEPHIIPRAGKGVGAVEVPRGILFHAYEYDDRGRVVNADCVIPTNQNHANIQKDLDALVPTLVDEDEASIELKTSMLVRAYDPCISCSTHFVDMTDARDSRRMVRFVRVDD